MTDRLIAELIAATGAACLLVGVAVIYWPAALITAGLLLLTLVTLAVLTDDGAHDEHDGAAGPPARPVNPTNTERMPRQPRPANTRKG